MQSYTVYAKIGRYINTDIYLSIAKNKELDGDIIQSEQGVAINKQLFSPLYVLIINDFYHFRVFDFGKAWLLPN